MNHLMKYLMRSLLALALLAALAPNPAALADQPVYDGSKTMQTLIVQSAASVMVEGDTLTLHGVPATVYFTNRPARIFGHMDNQAFADFVDQHPQIDPPNAALAILGSEQTVVLELLGAPMVEGDTISWKVRMLSGKLPAEAGPSSLFIDAFPTSVNNHVTD